MMWLKHNKNFSSKKFASRAFLILLFIAAFSTYRPVYAGEVLIAVAANFYESAKNVSEAFSKTFGHQVNLSSGSTGKIYTQIMHGAPYEVFLAADMARPQLLIKNGFSNDEVPFIYAYGRLVLWSPVAGLVGNQGKILHTDDFKHIAMANPELAPYGRAAHEFLMHKKIDKLLSPRLVYGENINQTLHFVNQGAAQLGFIALSQLKNKGLVGYGYLIPENQHSPIAQGAILLSKGRKNQAAIDFFKFLQGNRATKIIESSGYNIATESQDKKGK